MIFTIDSKTFIDIFLQLEDDDVILDSQYVIISNYLSVKNVQNNIVNYITLYPGPEVLGTIDKETQNSRYYDYLKERESLLATMVTYSIKEDVNIIMICNDKEYKIGYLTYIANFIYEVFGYPVYDYIEYISGCKLINYDKEKVLKRCKKITKKCNKKALKNKLSSSYGKERYIQSLSKKDMKKILKKKGLYRDDMTKEDMKDVLENSL